VTAEIIHGDCLPALQLMAADSVDAIVTDPPAGIAFMGKAWDCDKGGRREWIAWLASVMAEGLRVLKPGGYAFVWAIPRTSHWTATALEDAGFEIRDVVHHVFGSGFPKSKALLKPAAENWILARKPGPLRHLRIDDCRVAGMVQAGAGSTGFGEGREDGYRIGTGREYRTAGRWPANFVMSHAEGCERVGTKRVKGSHNKPSEVGMGSGRPDSPICNGVGGVVTVSHNDPDGTEEVPAWVCAEGCPVALMDEQSGVRKSGGGDKGSKGPTMGYGGNVNGWSHVYEPSTGTASRFFHCLDPDPFVYVAKASRRDRGEGNRHPTVKSTALMRHLIRLVAAPGDLVLDPFAGSGSTGVAALAEGCRFIGIEQDAESVETARRRCAPPASEAPQAAPGQLTLSV